LAPLRGRPGWVALAAALAEVLLALALGSFGHRDILGLAGAGAVLIGLTAAVLGGPWAGLAATTVGTLAFWTFIADTGETAPTSATVLAAVLWGVSVLVGGVVADALRDETAARRRANRETAALHRRLEGALLPSVPAVIGGYGTSTFYRTGEERLGLGGDFYDVQSLADGTLALLIGDVTGHGPHSAALGAALRAAWHGLVQADVAPESLVPALARVAVREAASEELFATAWLGWVGPSGTSLRMVSLGHPPPLLIAGGTRFLEAPPALPLGAWADEVTRPTEVALPAAWALMLYTDGLIEGRLAPGASERFGAERLQGWIESHGAPVPDDRVLSELLADLERANGGALADDVAVLVISRPAEPPPPSAARQADGEVAAVCGRPRVDVAAAGGHSSTCALIRLVLPGWLVSTPAVMTTVSPRRPQPAASTSSLASRTVSSKLPQAEPSNGRTPQTSAS
jgi:serine phosphatase RsbU (regulator of sigma subunit)